MRCAGPERTDFNRDRMTVLVRVGRSWPHLGWGEAIAMAEARARDQVAVIEDASRRCWRVAGDIDVDAAWRAMKAHSRGMARAASRRSPSRPRTWRCGTSPPRTRRSRWSSSSARGARRLPACAPGRQPADDEESVRDRRPRRAASASTKPAFGKRGPGRGPGVILDYDIALVGALRGDRAGARHQWSTPSNGIDGTSTRRSARRRRRRPMTSPGSSRSTPARSAPISPCRRRCRR